MSVRVRIILSFLALGIVIVLASALAVVPIKSELEKIGHFHTAALFSVQSMHSKLTEAVEESFAYIVSGVVEEKAEFFQWADEFSQETQTFYHLARLDQPGEEKENILYNKITYHQPLLVKQAQVLFVEYEATGSITLENFKKYEDTIDILTKTLEEFVAIERIEVEHSQQIALDTIDRAQYIIYGVGIFTLLAAIALGVMVSKRISNPIQALIQGTKDLGAGKTSVQMKVTSDDEIGILTQSFNEMAVQLQITREQLLHSEKLSAMGNLSASFAHEFNNPLTVVIRGLDHLSDQIIQEDQNKKLFDMINKECVRMAGLVKKLMEFHTPSSGEKELMNVHDLINEVLVLQEPILHQKSIMLAKKFAYQLTEIHVIPDQIKQVLMNLINNAEDAIMDKKGTITITTENTGDGVKIMVRDTGQGISPQNLKSVFDPFFTTKKKSQGMGLGLSVSFSIAKAHNGYLSVESKLGVGSTFILALPSGK